MMRIIILVCLISTSIASVAVDIDKLVGVWEEIPAKHSYITIHPLLMDEEIPMVAIVKEHDEYLYGELGGYAISGMSSTKQVGDSIIIPFGLDNKDILRSITYDGSKDQITVSADRGSDKRIFNRSYNKKNTQRMLEYCKMYTSDYFDKKAIEQKKREEEMRTQSIVNTSFNIVIVTVVLGVIIMIIRNGISKASEKARIEEQQRVWEKQQAAQKAAEIARQTKITELLRIGTLIHPPNEAWVTCSNRHHYKYKDFHIDSNYIEYNTEYEEVPPFKDRYGDIVKREVQRPYTGTDSRIGCPLCKTSEFTFDDIALQGFKLCRSCGYWHKSNDCPVKLSQQHHLSIL